VFLAAALLALPQVAAASFIVSVTPSVSPTASGTYLYAYTIANAPGSTLSALDFVMEISPTADLQAISTPTGWVTGYTAGDPFFYMISVDPSTDLAPGASMALSFESPLAPASGSYTLSGFNADFTEFGVATGTTLVPAADATPPTAVPEPGSFVAVAIGLVIGWQRIRSRGRAAS
jgi:hypothetical protein